MKRFWESARKLGREGFIDQDFVSKVTTETPQQIAQNYDKLKEKKSKKTAAEDKLPGGRADHAGDDEFWPASLREGARHEREHTDEPSMAREIAKDHLKEDPDYYKKLKSIEK